MVKCWPGCTASTRFSRLQNVLGSIRCIASGVDEEAGALRLEQRDVARAARRQYGNPQADRASLGKFFNLKIPVAPKQILKMMAERWTRVNKDYAIATMIYSRGEPWKSMI